MYTNSSGCSLILIYSHKLIPFGNCVLSSEIMNILEGQTFFSQY